MEWIAWILGAVFALCVMFVVVGTMAARNWSGEAVGAMRVRKRYMNGTHTRMRVAVRRSIRGKAAFRDVHLLVGPLSMQSALMLSQVEAVRCAELLERAAAEAGSRS